MTDRYCPNCNSSDINAFGKVPSLFYVLRKNEEGKHRLVLKDSDFQGMEDRCFYCGECGHEWPMTGEYVVTDDN